MMPIRRNQRLLCAYALLFTVAAGVIALDPVKRHTDATLADVSIPTPKTFASRMAPPVQAQASAADRLARR